MRLVASRLLAMGILFCSACALSARPASTIREQSPAATKQKTETSSKSQKLTNPLNDLLQEAQRDIEKGDFSAAIPPLQKVLADQPEFAYAHFQLAYAYTALKKPDEARAEYERTIALDPKMSEAYLNLGMLLLDQQQSAAAVAPLQKAVDLLPAQSRPRYLLAVAEERAGDAVGAAASFDALIHLDPNDITAINYLGEAALRKGKLTEAETRFRHALEVQPASLEAKKGLALSLDAQKKPEAAAAYREYLQTAPDDTAARSRLIRLLIEQNESDAALAELDRLDSGTPATVASLKLRADVQIAGKKWDDSVVTLQKAIALAPSDAQLHGGLGRIYMQKRDYANAEKELGTALRLDGKNLGYFKDLSSTFYLEGNYPAALASLDEIAKVEQPSAGTWFIRAICYDKLRQTKPALEAYQKFLELDQDKNPDQVWQAKERSKVLQHMLDRRR